MRRVLIVAKRELIALFATPLAYFVIAAFLLMACFFFFNLLGTYNVVINHYAELPQGIEYLGEQHFGLNSRVVAPYFHVLVLLLVLVVPLITMRALAEERKVGTHELVFTSPISYLELIFGKMLGAIGFLAVIIGLAGVLPLVLWYYGEPAPDLAPILLGTTSLFVCGTAFVAVGIAASACTDSPVIAGVLTTALLLLLCVVHAPAESLSAGGAKIVTLLSPLVHLERAFSGVVTLSALVYFTALTIVALTVALTCMEREAR